MKRVMQKPEPPENDDCCGEGCCPCVWDVYYNALDLWEAQQEKLQQDSNESTDSSS